MNITLRDLLNITGSCTIMIFIEEEFVEKCYYHSCIMGADELVIQRHLDYKIDSMRITKLEDCPVMRINLEKTKFLII